MSTVLDCFETVSALPTVNPNFELYWCLSALMRGNSLEHGDCNIKAAAAFAISTTYPAGSIKRSIALHATLQVKRIDGVWILEEWWDVPGRSVCPLSELHTNHFDLRLHEINYLGRVSRGEYLNKVENPHNGLSAVNDIGWLNKRFKGGRGNFISQKMAEANFRHPHFLQFPF